MKRCMSILGGLLCSMLASGAVHAAPLDDPNQPRMSMEWASLRREVFHQQIAALGADPNRPVVRKADELSTWVERLNALSIPRPEPAAGTAAAQVALKTPTGPATSAVGAVEAPSDPNAPVVDPLVTVAESEPGRIAFPLEAADALFSAGKLHEAWLFYRVALGRTKANATHKDRPWILLQMANCLRYRDGEQAEALYKQLIAEYPDHPFAPVAKAQQQVLLLAKHEDPLTTLKRYGHDPNDF